MYNVIKVLSKNELNILKKEVKNKTGILIKNIEIIYSCYSSIDFIDKNNPCIIQSIEREVF